MNKNKTTESQKKLLMVLLMAIVFFAAYRFVYQPLTQETEALAEENTAMENEIADLKNKARNAEIYQTETEANRTSIREILAKFGAGVTPEKSILFFIELAQAAQVQIPTISFGDATLLYTTSSLKNDDGMPYSQYVATYNVAYSTTYEGLKTLIAYVSQYPERMHLNTLTAAYNNETDSLSGNFSIDWYMLTGTDKAYRFEDLEMIDIGNENIFRSGSGAPGGDGFDFEFDFGDASGEDVSSADGEPEAKEEDGPDDAGAVSPEEDETDGDETENTEDSEDTKGSEEDAQEE